MPIYNLWGQSVDIEIPEDVFPDEKWRDAKDEMFHNNKHGFFESTYQGKQLHYRYNLPEKSKPKAIMIWQHGIVGQSGFGMKYSGDDGRYTDYALRSRMLNEAGIAVYAHDALGHGFSEGTRFYIPNGRWTLNRDDFVAFTKLVASKHEPGTPIFLAGDSYGGCLAIHAAKVFQDSPDPNVNLKGICVNCPAIEGDLPPFPVIWFLSYGLAPFFPTWTPSFMPHPITAERVWKDEEPRAFFSDKEQMHGLSQGGVAFCLGTALGLLGALQAVQALIPDFELPFHINHGTEDKGVPIAGAEFMMDRAKTPIEDRHLNRIEGGYHALFSEPDAPKYIQSELAFMDKILSKK